MELKPITAVDLIKKLGAFNRTSMELKRVLAGTVYKVVATF